MARSLPKVCPFLVTVDLKLKWPELPVARITPPYLTYVFGYLEYRAAAFDVTGRKTTETSSVIFRFSHKTAWQESSDFYSDLRNASRSELTKYYCVNYHCSAVTMPIRSSSYAASSTSELLVSVQLPFNSMFFCHAEVLSHVVL